MGCGTSRLEPGEEIPAGMLFLRRRMNELRRSRTEEPLRNRGERKDSIMSSTELLRPEELVADDYEVPSRGKDEGHRKAADDEEEGEEAEGRRICFGRGQTAAEEVYLPGSPSFRFYFADVVEVPDETHPVQDAVVVHAPKIEKPFEEQELLQKKENYYERFASGEESDMKGIKKAKARKFMALPKANFLNVRGCYSMNSASLSAQAPSFISEKAT